MNRRNLILLLSSSVVAVTAGCAHRDRPRTTISDIVGAWENTHLGYHLLDIRENSTGYFVSISHKNARESYRIHSVSLTADSLAIQLVGDRGLRNRITIRGRLLQRDLIAFETPDKYDGDRQILFARQSRVDEMRELANTIIREIGDSSR